MSTLIPIKKLLLKVTKTRATSIKREIEELENSYLWRV